MRINKILLSVVASVFVLAWSTLNAQNDNKIFEVGPNNISGRITSLVLDQRDASNSTIFAGAATGGLFLYSQNNSILVSLYEHLGKDVKYASNNTIWHHIPYTADGKEITLPIKSMVQGPDNKLYIGTGDMDYQIGSTYKKMSALGMGLFIYNPDDASFKVVPGTTPAGLGEDFAAINALGYIYRNNTLYFYAATNDGLYRWTISEDGDWDNAASREKVFEGTVSQMVISHTRNVMYFSVGNQLYQITDLTLSKLTINNISENNLAFGQHNKTIKLALAPSDNRYVYAMVIGSNNLMEHLYLTTNDQDWIRLTTTTVTPLTTNSGMQCGAMIVDQDNPKRIYIAGNTVWAGQGYVEGSNYQWTMLSYDENTLNRGNYMSSVFSSNVYVHSGIQQMIAVPDPTNTLYGTNYYIATDGGVFYTKRGFNSFESLNRGLNTVQINGLAVSPDGTIVSGANNNSCPVIEPRFSRYGGSPEVAWYDNGTLGNFNHDANIIYTGNGGQVAASAFQQFKPTARRNIFVSANGGQFARAYNDYLDYTNTQTWTNGADFVSTAITGGPDISQVYLWEKYGDTIFHDSVKVAIDTVSRDTSAFIFDENGDTLLVSGGSMEVKPGYTAIFNSRAHADYPFTHTFTKEECVIKVGKDSTRARTVADSIVVKNPIVARMLVLGQSTNSLTWEIYYTWRATDFTKVYNAEEKSSGNYNHLIVWAPIYSIARSTNANKHLYPRTMTMSNDGRYAFVVVQDTLYNRSKIVRLSGFDQIDYYNHTDEAIVSLTNQATTTATTLIKTEELSYNGDVWIPRIISSLAVDQRDGTDDIVVTFEGYNSTFSNVAVLTNATAENWTLSEMSLADSSLPVFCAMVEKTTGDIYVGTTNGVYINEGGNASEWKEYNKLPKVIVTSIKQQINEFPIRRNIGHNGITKLKYVFAKTKWPNAIYFGTYGRGIFLDMQYVTDTVNEIVDSIDYVDIPVVNAISENSVSIYPNPVSSEAHIILTAATRGNGVINIYDINGRRVATRTISNIEQGENNYTIDCSNLPKGMYLVNINTNDSVAVAKMIVK